MPLSLTTACLLPRCSTTLCALFTLAALPGLLNANGLDRNGVGARSMGMAGASAADAEDAFSSMALNPGLLGFASGSDLHLSLGGVTGSGDFQNQYGGSGDLDEDWHLIPDIVWRTALNDDVTLGLSVIPDSSREADWFYRDPAGGAGGNASYGWRHHHSSITNIRAALGLGVRVSDTVSLGASVGGVYTKNELHTPYIFQSHPALAGMKTLLDMETDGFGINGDLGLVWQATKKLAFGLTYRTPTHFETEGEATGDIGAQLRSLGLKGVPSKFRYDSEIETELPQKVTLGTSWQAHERVRFSAQVDWVNWSRAFDQLDVHLSNGSNPAINGLLGTDRIDDTIPLDWKDRFVYRAGVEVDLTDCWVLRAGYVYGKSPVPDSTVLPMTAAISEHTIALGVGYKGKSCTVDLAVQHDLEATQRAGVSGITGTEYDNSRMSVKATWVAVTVGFKF